MITSNKKLKNTGILFVVSALAYIIYMVLITVRYEMRFSFDSLQNIVLTAAVAILLALYCFRFSNERIGKILYLIAFALNTALYTYYCITNLIDDQFTAYVLEEIFYIVIVGSMLATKLKKHTVYFVVGAVGFIGYSLLLLLSLISDLTRGWFDVYSLMYEVFVVTEVIALVKLWLIEGGNILFRKKSTTGKTPLEDNLLSLKQLYDNNIISEEEYNQKKAEILNKL